MPVEITVTLSRRVSLASSRSSAFSAGLPRTMPQAARLISKGERLKGVASMDTTSFSGDGLERFKPPPGFGVGLWESKVGAVTRAVKCRFVLS